MTKITACEIFNQIDNKYYTLHVEWFNLHFKVMLLNSTMSPLTGEMNTKNINDFSNELSKSSDKYIEETKKILRGKDTEIQFFLQDKILEWKSDLWTLGRIELCVVSDFQVRESFQQLLKFYQNIQDKMTLLEEENKNLINVNKEINSKIEKLIQIKITMEQDLYKKFIVVLNSKKKKIKELQDAIKKKENVKESVFDACTDEESEKEDETVKDISTIIKVSKRKLPNYNSPKNIQESEKTNHIVADKIIPKASTSKDYARNEVHTPDEYAKEMNKNEEKSCSPKKSRSNLNFVEEESEEELFSQ
ncbi:DNA repair protein XRCC4-like [Bombus pascuorum]|uniref:DNA repair protein XRCC4-like n=1 Tax=Bombus pascuorum TaxID=65598 RepID=UPI002145CE61|nr:DNA repair protein XRCC4-like [Bombus pascuorum]